MLLFHFWLGLHQPSSNPDLLHVEGQITREEQEGVVDSADAVCWGRKKSLAIECDHELENKSTLGTFYLTVLNLCLKLAML